MAGFSVLITTEPLTAEHQQDFHTLSQNTARYKGFNQPSCTVSGLNCLAAKFDSPATLHPGIVHDPQTGSWLLAAGTVVALEGRNGPVDSLESLLEAYIQYGEKALDQYDGHFALVIYNGQNDSCSIVSDPMGLFSIFYGRMGNNFYISSSALAVARQIRTEPDILAVEHFLRAGRLDSDRTLWKGVKRMLAAKVLNVANGRLVEHTYWMPTQDSSIANLAMENALGQYDEILTKTFSRLLEREGETWLDLTGGFDSRLVATFMAKLGLPFVAYCTGTEDHPDVQLSRMISDTMKWEYVHSQPTEQADMDLSPLFQGALGYGDGGASILRFARTRYGFATRNTIHNTNVTGIGGENLRGYYWQIEKNNIGRTTTVSYPALIDHLIPGSVPPGVMRYNRYGELREDLLNFVLELCAPYADLPNNVQIDRVEMYRDAGHGGAYLSSNTGIQRSLAPLCFKEPCNFAFSLNYRWKLPRTYPFLRVLLERENPTLANLPTTLGGPAIPIRVTNIHRFWPLWKAMANRAFEIGSKKILGKSLSLWRAAKSTSLLPTWREAFHRYAMAEGMLNHDTMVSAGLYQRDAFNAYIARNALSPNNGSEFIDHVISVEMALRETDCFVKT